MLLLVPISQHNRMKVQKRELISLAVLQDTEILDQPNETSIQHHRQEISIVVVGLDFFLHCLAEGGVDRFFSVVG